MSDQVRILLLDDSEAERELAKEAVQEFARDLLLITTATPDEAEKQVQRFLPSLVLIDLHLGRWNGRDLLSRLSGTLGAIILSTSADADEARLCVAAGALAFWTKPRHFEDFVHLFAKIRRLVALDAAQPVPTQPAEARPCSPSSL